MTQRHADSDDETYVTLGRPFELLETAEDVQKAKSRKDKDQFVTDSQGRRRFHGAFTGGFSAGYYNTVGSKEGWNPSSFKSTRGERSEFGGQRPEDFMDEEDFGAHGIAPKVVSAQEQFIQSQGERKRPATEDGVIPGVPPLENLVVPTKISIGARLLKAMGWREGEGVGPKTVKYHPKQDRVYGPARPGPSVEATSKIAEGFMFAPRDSTTWEFSGKDDLHGLDYRGMEERGVLSTRKATKDLYGMRGEAFGTGALEDEEGDDENVYGVESMTSYDVSLAGEGDLSMERSFGWTGRENDTWDLSSFSKALKKPVHYKSHPPPNVPKSFVLVHKFKKISAATDPSLGKPLSSTSRSHLLADTSGSVFGLLSPADRERLKNAVERTKDEPKSQSSTDQKREQPVAAPVAKNVTEWENEGKDRMTRAAAIYKPLGTSLASRFTRSGENQEAPKSPESDAVQAARSSMFGALTREIQDWYPHRIVCKRFNIPDPYPGQNFVGVDDGKKKRQDKNRAINFELTEKMVTDVPDEDPSPAVAEVMKEVSQEGSTDDQKEMQDDRPPMDLFKEIFANSDSEDESEETMHNNPSNIILSPALLNECKDIPVTSSRKQPIEMSNDTQWKDLSAISSSVKPSEDVKLPSISLKKYQYPLVSVADQSSNELKSAVASYGPSLPPGRDSNDHMSDKAGSVIRRQPNDYEHERHRTTHKKHKREERREHKERKKKKHKHSKH